MNKKIIPIIFALVLIASASLSTATLRLQEPANNVTGMFNVNSSQFWDNLDTPDDIIGSEFWYNQSEEVGGNFVRKDGDNMTGNLNISNGANITVQDRWVIDLTFMGSLLASRASFLNLVPTITVPNIVPTRSDDNTGIGRSGSDFLVLIAGGIFGLGVVETSNLIEVKVNGTLNVTGDIFVEGNSSFFGSLNMNSNNITGVQELIAVDGSAIRFGAPTPFSGFDQAITTVSNQTIGEGVVTHALLDRQGEKVIAAWQSGKNNSGHYNRNSMGIFPDLNITNASILTNVVDMWSRFGITPLFDYFSEGNRTALGVLFGIETQQLRLHNALGNGLFVGEGVFRWVSDGDIDIDLYGAPVHIFQERFKQIGFAEGDEVNPLFERFNDLNLGVFQQETTGAGINEWAGIVTTLCPEGLSDPCSRSLASGGSQDKVMATSFSTANLSDLTLVFDIDTLDYSSGGDFEATIDNNEGSGEVSLYTLSGVDENDIIISDIPSSMANRSVVTLRIKHASSHPNKGQVYLDDIQVNGTAEASTLANVSVGDGKLEFGKRTGSTDSIFYNGTSNNFTISSLAGTYVNGEAFVCVNDNGMIFTSEDACA